MPRPAPTSLADALFSHTKKAAIGVLFTRPGQGVHLRELARLAGVSPAMMAKEMALLVGAGLVTERPDGNRRVFSAHTGSPVFEELASIARKTAGLGDVLRQALAKVAGIELAFVFGSLARGPGTASSDVDVCVVGTCDYAELLAACTQAASLLGRPVNPVMYGRVELAQLAREGNVFVADLLQRPRMALTGEDDDIARALGQELGQPAPARAADRTRRHAG